MMRKSVPFVSNSKDNMHCVNAVFRMIHKYYFGKDLTWKEIDTLTKAIPGKATWTFIGEMEFAKKGLDITNIEPIEYKKLYEEGFEYLNTAVGKEVANYYFTRSNLQSVLPYIPDFLKTVKHETRRATVSEISMLLKENTIIAAEINSAILNHYNGFSLHFVLLYDTDGKNIILHDPGLPPIKARKVSFEEFDKCFNFKGANGEIAVFKKHIK